MFRKKIVKFIVVLSAVVAVSSAFLYAKSKYIIPIAMYHSVSPNPDKNDRLTVSPETFDRQMNFLAKNKYNIVTLDTVADLLNNRKKIPQKTISITFDDGYENNFVYAFPILKKYGIKVNIFLIVSFIGKENYLNWEQIKEMNSSGLVEFASHTMTHPFLETLQNKEELLKEIKDSKDILEKTLNKKVYALAYPCGRFTQEVKDITRESGYVAAVATNPGKKCPDNDLFALKRIRISESAKNMFIFWFETSGYYNFIRERRHK